MHKIAPVPKWLIVIVLAIVAIAAAFHFDGAVRAWVTEHSNRTVKQFMRTTSRYGDWPEHILAGLLLVAIAWWRGSERWVRIGLTMILACALAGTASRHGWRRPANGLGWLRLAGSGRLRLAGSGRLRLAGSGRLWHGSGWSTLRHRRRNDNYRRLSRRGLARQRAAIQQQAERQEQQQYRAKATHRMLLWRI